MGRKDSLYHASALRYRIRLAVCVRRYHGTFSRSDLDRYPVARHLFSGWSFPFDHGRRRNLRHLWRHLLLVPQDVWAHDERRLGQGSLLANIYWSECDLHADAYHGHHGAPEALRSEHGIPIPFRNPFLSSVYHVGGNHHRCGPTALSVQFLLELVQREESHRQSMGSNNAGMDDSFPAAA